MLGGGPASSECGAFFEISDDSRFKADTPYLFLVISTIFPIISVMSGALTYWWAYPPVIEGIHFKQGCQYIEYVSSVNEYTHFKNNTCSGFLQTVSQTAFRSFIYLFHQ